MTFYEVRYENYLLTQQKQQEFFSTFVQNFESTWNARTTCASGHEIERCANYPSSARLEKTREQYKSCYEAEPKQPPKECPAGVTQRSPRPKTSRLPNAIARSSAQ